MHRPVVGRLAPSPTGALHLGHAFSFLIAWWSARAQRGKVILRWEDLDGERCDAAWIDLARGDLVWLGLDWDEEQVQSEHLERIRAGAKFLEQAGVAYACTCSRGDIQRVLSAPHAGETQIYPGTCRGRYASLAQAEATRGGAGLRFAVSDRLFSFEDRIAGPYAENLEQRCGDFLILRRDKLPAYQLAVVVDDAASLVTEVVRGRDLLASTARQLALFEAMGELPPSYAHVPLVTDEMGRRLAKRADDVSLRQLREARIDPRAIVSWVARSSGLDVPDRVTAHDVITLFDFRHVTRNEVRLTNSVLSQLFAQTI